MKLEVYPLRFEFIARESLRFPPGKAGNTLRGALGLALRRISPSGYAQVFDPRAGKSGSPSGLADWPRPFVFRSRHLDGVTIGANERFHFDLNLFLLDRELARLIIQAFDEIAREGFGPGRGKAELTHVPVQKAAINLDPPTNAVSRIRVDFLSPTELKHEDGIAERPEFPILFARIRDRVSTLGRLCGAEPLEIDYPGSNARALAVKMAACEIRRHEVERRSSKTGQVHSIGGFTGTAEYEGDLAEFLPYLQAAKWTGAGRQASWGKGEIDVTVLCES